MIDMPESNFFFNNKILFELQYFQGEIKILSSYINIGWSYQLFNQASVNLEKTLDYFRLNLLLRTWIFLKRSFQIL